MRWQIVPSSRGGYRKTTFSKFLFRTGISNTQSVCRAQPCAARISPSWNNKLGDVRLSLIVKQLIDNEAQFIDYTLPKTLPVKLITQQRCNVITSRPTVENPRRRIQQ